MKRTKLWDTMLGIFFALWLLMEGVTAAYVFRLNMLPDVYCAMLVGVFSFLAVGVGILLLAHRKGKQVGAARRIGGSVLIILTICGCGMLCAVATDVYETVHTIARPAQDTDCRSIFIRADDPAQTLTDTAEYTFAAVENYDTESTLQAIGVIEAQLGKKLSVVYYSSVAQMVDGLYAGQADAIILSGAYAQILEEIPNYENFSDRTRILEDVPVTGRVPVADTTDPPDISDPTQANEETDPTNLAEPNVTNTPFIFYISGSDTRNNYLPILTRSDVNILAVVNPVTKQILLLNTPRDYYVVNPAGNGMRDKLAHCGVYGLNCSIQAMEELYDIELHYYARINFTGFETLIDAIGGVTVCSDVAFSTSEFDFVAGENFLNGKQALAFARERKSFAAGDNMRGQNQMKVIRAVIDKMTSGSTLIANYSKILDSMSGMFETSMTAEQISQLVKMQLSDMAGWTVQTYAVTGSNGWDETYSAPGMELAVMYVDEDMVAHAKELIRKVIAGETLTEEDLK